MSGFLEMINLSVAMVRDGKEFAVALQEGHWKDGKEYYVGIVHPQYERIYRQYEAENSAGLAARAAGRDWRRVKREMRKAGLAWKRSNPRT